jgi:hypothetical protein
MSDEEDEEPPRRRYKGWTGEELGIVSMCICHIFFFFFFLHSTVYIRVHTYLTGCFILKHNYISFTVCLFTKICIGIFYNFVAARMYKYYTVCT